jgi:hypothetical protein
LSKCIPEANNGGQGERAIARKRQSNFGVIAVFAVVFLAAIGGAAWWIQRDLKPEAGGKSDAMAGTPRSLPDGPLTLVSRNVSETRLLSMETLRRTTGGAEATVILLGNSPTAIDQRYAIEAKRELVDCKGRRIADERAAYFDREGKPVGAAYLISDDGRDADSSDTEITVICGRPASPRTVQGWRAVQREVQTPPDDLPKRADADRKDAVAWAWLCASEARGRWRRQAPADCDHAVALLPHDTALTRDQAFVKLVIGQRAAAVTGLHKVLAADPTDAVALYGLAIAAAQSGDKAGSKALRVRAVGLDPRINGRVYDTYQIDGDAYLTR